MYRTVAVRPFHYYQYHQKLCGAVVGPFWTRGALRHSVNSVRLTHSLWLLRLVLAHTLSPHSRPASASLQDKLFPAGPDLEVVVGDVYQFSTLPAALGDANAIIVATGASDRVDPLGPFNVDFEVSYSSRRCKQSSGSHDTAPFDPRQLRGWGGARLSLAHNYCDLCFMRSPSRFRDFGDAAARGASTAAP